MEMGLISRYTKSKQSHYWIGVCAIIATMNNGAKGSKGEGLIVYGN